MAPSASSSCSHPIIGARRGPSPGASETFDWFAEQAAAAGYPVLRLDSAFSAALHAGIRLDFLPIDGHWTAAANLLAAQLAAGALSSEGR